LFVAGLVTMGCGPVLFTVSALAVLFKRRRRRLW